MNVGIVTYWFERGAAYVSRQYRDVLQKQHRVFIYARSEEYARGDARWDDKSVTWSKRCRYGTQTAIDLKDFRRWLESNQIELVIFNEQHWWLPILLCNNLGIKTAAYVDYYTEETVPFFACYDLLLCNTRRHYSVFEDHPQCLYIPWGTDTTAFKPRSLAPVEPGYITFFHSCGFSPRRKGTDLVIRAFATLPDKARLVIHSQKPLKPLLPELAEQIQALEACGRLHCCEETVTTPGLYHLGDVYVYPSRLEGIGLTITEAMACGLPVITTDHPPMSEFVVPELNGLLVAVDRLIARADGYYWPQSLINLDSLRQQMTFYLQNSDSLATYKTNARQFAEQRLNWMHNAECLLGFVEKIQKRPASQTKRPSEQVSAFENKRTVWAHRHPTIFYLADLAYEPLRALRRVVKRG